MPEVFTNNYFFTSPSSLPTPESLRDQLAAAFKTSFTLSTHPLGDHGAPRAYATLESPGLQIWAYWEPERPEIELVIDRPMERMLSANSAMISLGAKPRYPDQSWRHLRRSRTYRTIRKILFTLLALSAAIATIHSLHWWGLLKVLLNTPSVVSLYIILLARSFRH